MAWQDALEIHLVTTGILYRYSFGLLNITPLCRHITFQIGEHLSYFYFLFFQTLLFIRLTASISTIGAQAVFYIQSKSLGMALGISAMC